MLLLPFSGCAEYTKEAYPNNVYIKMDELTPNNLLEKIRPNMYFLSKEWTTSPVELKALQQIKCEIVSHPQAAGISTTALSKEKIFSNSAVFFDRDGILNKSIIKKQKPYSPRFPYELKLNHEVLTPNTRQILNESEASIKKWYKKTFHDELNQCSNDVPMPPISNTEPIHIPQKNHPSNDPNLKNNVKKLINIKEMEIKRNQPQHNTQNYQIQYMNRGNRKHNTNRKHFAQ